ncbi:MAG: PA2779 family protein [Zoogloeaceae bacterium]|uniref:PA2779 family protein n=1 Tax=Denitromonas sp. TaxID=2734609 RepID=UPI001DF3B557|nr:PA2779 family protein [Rhodocyclaceae bacterium]MCP5220242.1 PA2779 family protein [Zoogloeaceae bacterium]HQU89258.1 PA2779 family protein [Denitromonas sp.]
MTLFKRLFSVLLAVCFANGVMIQTAQAALVSTEQVARVAATDASAHQRLNDMLARADVQAELERLGLSPDLAKERIAALTDSEAAALAQQIDSAPAGGIIGAILLVFFVLLVTDILGFTKVFPFTRSVR